MRLLLTNDDGIDAPGLRALGEAVDGVGDAVVIAPTGPRSGCSHSITTDRPFRCTHVADNRYAVEGTPADCVRVGLHHFGGDIAWVLAGINCGGNLGVDVYHSGTAAGAREAALRGVPAIAVSHYHNRAMTESDWKRAAKWTRSLLDDLLQRPAELGTFWNINLPILDPNAPSPEVVFCPLDPSPLPLSFANDDEMFAYNGEYSRRDRQKGADVDTCFGGRIAVTRITVMETSR